LSTNCEVEVVVQRLLKTFVGRNCNQSVVLICGGFFLTDLIT